MGDWFILDLELVVSWVSAPCNTMQCRAVQRITMVRIALKKFDNFLRKVDPEKDTNPVGIMITGVLEGKVCLWSRAGGQGGDSVAIQFTERGSDEKTALKNLRSSEKSCGLTDRRSATGQPTGWPRHSHLRGPTNAAFVTWHVITNASLVTLMNLYFRLSLSVYHLLIVLL